MLHVVKVHVALSLLTSAHASAPVAEVPSSATPSTHRTDLARLLAKGAARQGTREG